MRHIWVPIRLDRAALDKIEYAIQYIDNCGQDHDHPYYPSLPLIGAAHEAEDETTHSSLPSREGQDIGGSKEEIYLESIDDFIFRKELYMSISAHVGLGCS